MFLQSSSQKNNRLSRVRRQAKKRAFNLIEVLIALAVCSIGILSIVALIPVGLSSERDSSSETSAVNLLHMIDVDIANTPSTNQAGSAITASYRYNLPLPRNYATSGAVTNTFYVDGGLQLTNSAASGGFAVVCCSYPPATNGIASPPAALVQIYWPAQASTNTLRECVESYITFSQDGP